MCVYFSMDASFCVTTSSRFSSANRDHQIPREQKLRN